MKNDKLNIEMLKTFNEQKEYLISFVRSLCRNLEMDDFYVKDFEQKLNHLIDIGRFLVINEDSLLSLKKELEKKKKVEEGISLYELD